MNKADGKICMAKLARVKHQQAEAFARTAELLAEEAALLDELTEGETVDMRTGRARAKYQSQPAPLNVTEQERAEVKQLSRDSLSAEQKALKAERALGELSLSVLTHADRKRIDIITDGLRALDDEQGNAKGAIDDLLAALETGYSASEVIEDLRDLSKVWREMIEEREPADHAFPDTSDIATRAAVSSARRAGKLGKK